jgi:uncharacterized protein YbjT (DUF2867 family)
MSTFAILGASGRMGGATARKLLARGHKVRALTRNPDSAPVRALAAAGSEIVLADMASAESLAQAFAGADGVFNVQPAFDARGRYHFDVEVQQGNTVAEGLRQAGIGHVVYGSAGTGKRTGVPHFDAKIEIEAALRSACPKVTVLRPAPFMELMTDPGFMPRFSTWGVEPKVTGWDTPKPWICLDDIGEVAALAFSRPGDLGGRELFLAGDVLSLREARHLFATITGHTPRGVALPVWLFRWMVGDELVQMWTFIRERGSDLKLDPTFLRSVHPGALTVEQWIRNRHGF